jgi:hypothetical protein
MEIARKVLKLLIMKVAYKVLILNKNNNSITNPEQEALDLSLLNSLLLRPVYVYLY